MTAKEAAVTVWQAWVDFNETDDDDHIFTLTKFVAPGVTVAVGERLLLGDTAGNRCYGIVSAIDDDLIDLALDAATFRSVGARKK